MRTNLTGFALTVGMGLIVILMGFGLLSAAGLAGFSASDAAALTEQNIQLEPEKKEFYCLGPGGGSAEPYVPASAEEADAIRVGDALFKANCTQCHSIHEEVVGPPLARISKRRPIEWLVPWVHNSAKVIASGDAYAVKIFEENGKQQMPSFPQLSDKEIKAILAWITSQEDGVMPGIDAAPSNATTVAVAN